MIFILFFAKSKQIKIVFVATPGDAGSHAKPPREERPGVFNGDALRGRQEE